MFQTLKRAGLKPSEFATLLGLSRITVYNWKVGRSKPHSLIADRVKKTLNVLDKLVIRRKLPLPPYSAKIRREKLRKLKGVLDKAL